MTTYLYGSEHLVRRVFPDAEMKTLRLHHLLGLSTQDVIVTSRPWSPLLEGMLLLSPNRRPRIVQVADGIVFPINANKPINQRYGGLQNRILADVFFAMQNQADFELISQEPELVRGAVETEAAMTDLQVQRKAAVLLAGNDPFFEFPHQEVIVAFLTAAERLRRLGVEEVLLSCPEPSLLTALTNKLPWLRPIGKLKDHEGDLNHAIFVGSPSTVLLEHQKQGGVALLLALYNDPVLARYFSKDDVLDEVQYQQDGRMLIQALSVRSSRKTAPAFADLLSDLPRRPRPDLTFSEYLKSIPPRLVVRELHLLIGGAP